MCISLVFILIELQYNIKFYEGDTCYLPSSDNHGITVKRKVFQGWWMLFILVLIVMKLQEKIKSYMTRVVNVIYASFDTSVSIILIGVQFEFMLNSFFVKKIMYLI